MSGADSGKSGRRPTAKAQKVVSEVSSIAVPQWPSSGLVEQVVGAWRLTPLGRAYRRARRVPASCELEFFLRLLRYENDWITVYRSVKQIVVLRGTRE